MKSGLFPSALYLVVLTLALSTAAVCATDETQAELLSQSKITQEVAARTALAKVPMGEIKSAELEKENGKLVWSFDITLPKSKNIAEVQVDAKTGKIVSNKIETPNDQAKEAAADNLEKRK